MHTLAAGVSYVDLNFQGRSRVVASVILDDVSGVAIVDPGPSSTLPTLRLALERAGIAFSDVTTLLLTHIHLDHAGATGTLVAENPGLRVYVHERGAPHLIDPSKLVASATRLYGESMDRLWGPVMPVPASAIEILRGAPEEGEQVKAGGRLLEVAYTPGHATHHVSYFNSETGIAFVGDTGGVKLQPDGYALPPTPPPDIDLESWRDSLRRIEAWRPDTLFLTHFGPVGPAEPHLAEFRDHLERIAGLVKVSLDQPGDNDAGREAWFKDQVMRELRTRVSDEEARGYEVAGPFDLNWRGLARYWRRKETSRR